MGAGMNLSQIRLVAKELPARLFPSVPEPINRLCSLD